MNGVSQIWIKNEILEKIRRERSCISICTRRILDGVFFFFYIYEWSYETHEMTVIRNRRKKVYLIWVRERKRIIKWMFKSLSSAIYSLVFMLVAYAYAVVFLFCTQQLLHLAKCRFIVNGVHINKFSFSSRYSSSSRCNVHHDLSSVDVKTTLCA